MSKGGVGGAGVASVFAAGLLLFLTVSWSAVIHAIFDPESSARRGNPPLEREGVCSIKAFV